MRRSGTNCMYEEATQELILQLFSSDLRWPREKNQIAPAVNILSEEEKVYLSYTFFYYSKKWAGLQDTEEKVNNFAERRGEIMQKRKQRRRILGALLALGLTGLLIWRLAAGFLPSLREMAAMQADSLASDILAAAMEEIITENHLEEKDFVTYFRDEEGKIFAYTVDTVTINRLTSGVIAKMNELIAAQEDMIIRIPLGSVSGHSLLAGLGVDVPFRVRLVGNTGANYEREFVSAGINVINHRIWIRMEVTVQVAAPLITEVRTSYMDFPIVDQFISGDTPLTYLGVAP